MKFSSNTLFIILAIVVVLAGIYWYFSTGSSEVPLTASAPAAPAETQFLDLAGQLAPVTFDTSIFADPHFATLVDLGTPISPEPVGKNDPFAPFASGAR